MINTIIFFIIFIVILAAQYYLSDLKSKWAGIIIPMLFFSGTVIYCIGILSQQIITSSILFDGFLTLVIINVPTYILLMIHYVRRKAKKDEKEQNQ